MRTTKYALISSKIKSLSKRRPSQASIPSSPLRGPISTPSPSPNLRIFARSLTSSRLWVLSDELKEIVGLIRRNEGGMESYLSAKSPKLSHSAVTEILRSLNSSNASALRFFNWVLSSSPGFKPNPESYNLVIDNLGRLQDFGTMILLLKQLSLQKHCVTEKAFAFLTFFSGSSLEEPVRRVTEVLNEVGGSCRGSGIFSLIKVLCRLNSFDLAVFVMEETGRRTSYYNVLIAAKCRNGDFHDARNVLDEMRRFGCDPNMNSYNYLLGSLFKHKRVVEACDLMEAMEGMGYCPNSLTFEIVAIHACRTNKMDFGMEFLNRMLSEGIRPRLTMHAAFVKGYFSAGRVDDAYKYVNEMSAKDKCSANVNYSLLARLLLASGRVVEAGGILHGMMEKGLKPNFPVYVKVMKDLHKMSRGDLSSQLKYMFSKFIPSKEARIKGY
ncbi:pentatricopeptide repeat-containing protein At1g09900-like [Asparagus officinalis]|uniref:pentatricopeptide repeat-containing protein At1g09900-like n=1 Tax=Asparagus officinalis TaxID=4686 RepID=UPI00098E3378|nr:pentatricopeptide repeat-containing protein At1g09900-like [Asparagus officinalis]XP_020248308.1 pentatricopeptide repeat-containing protein At1g09900-like [Asparagus officinalis]XP_020248309.1 pentatricopeptide repeat-containing protein At1g09900-like [Asparagus officinalis]XP_020248310.1 pentatricopeptide repeat-containing protein At1g09900-like [Asparagus officinalis]XP_020248311.1 pentatricopeptide repeat-containing protein At1g09900-like [Asparagus officinalis]XP_020248312.1 pentatrico